MIKRQITDKIRNSLNQQAAVVLLGPRQVGKTTLAQDVSTDFEAVYLDLERSADRNKLTDPSLYFQQQAGKLIIIDEVQRQPELFAELRSQIDANRRAGHRTGQFLLLGSASNQLLHQSSESLAGRVSYLELFALNLLEIEAGQADQLWLNGGFPDAFLHPKNSMGWRRDFIRTYLERDIPALGSRISSQVLERFWTMLAHNQGQIFNASQLGGSLGVKGQTANRYLDLMTDLMLVRRLAPWHANVGKRLVKSPKSYIRDSGLLHALLNITSMDGLLGHPVIGASWEGWVIENIISICSSNVRPYYYRTSAGAEIDLVLDLGHEQWAIEIKHSTAPKLTKGFYNACEDLGPARKYVVYSGDDSYPIADDVEAVSLKTVMERLIES